MSLVEAGQHRKCDGQTNGETNDKRRGPYVPAAYAHDINRSLQRHLYEWFPGILVT